MIISFSGSAGSGKSTIAKKIAEKLGWDYFYIGEIRRAKAKERGMTLAEYNKYGEEHPETDLEVDEFQKDLGLKSDNFIIEGRTSWYFIPHSLKVFLYVDEITGAKRILNHLKEENQRNEDSGLENLNAVLASLRERKKSDDKRYEKYYNIDINSKSNYDFYLDTSKLDKEQAYKKVFKFIKTNIDKSKKV